VLVVDIPDARIAPRKAQDNDTGGGARTCFVTHLRLSERINESIIAIFLGWHSTYPTCNSQLAKAIRKYYSG